METKTSASIIAQQAVSIKAEKSASELSLRGDTRRLSGGSVGCEGGSKRACTPSEECPCARFLGGVRGGCGIIVGKRGRLKGLVGR